MNSPVYDMGYFIGHIVAIIIFIALLILVIKLFVGLIMLLQGKKKRNAKLKLKNNLKHYEEAGLSENDIKIFRETMQEAKEEILHWEEATKKNVDISVVEDVTKGLESAKRTFQFIVKNPQELNKQGDFLYRYLPNMRKLLETYGSLIAEPTQNERDKDETLLLIRTLSSKVAKNYHDILMQDIKVIGKEIDHD